MITYTPKKNNESPLYKREKKSSNDFFRACESGDFSTVKECLADSEAIIALENDKAETGLMLACKNGHYEVVKLLIKAKADIHCKDYKNNTLVHLAILKNHHQVLKLLIKYQANIDDFDVNNEFTPIMLAIKNRNYIAMQYLLDNIDLSKKDKNREDIYDYVLSNNNISANTRFMFSSHNRTKDEYSKRTKVHKILLSKSEHISKMNTKEMFQFLRANNLGKEDVYYFVFTKKHEHILVNLIKNTSFVSDLRIIPNGYDREYPFFLLTVKENLLDVVKALIEKGVNVNHTLQEFEEDRIFRLFSKNEIGYSPLMLAYKEGHIEMVDLLLECNADVNVKNKDFKTVIDMAKENNDKKMQDKFKLFI